MSIVLAVVFVAYLTYVIAGSMRRARARRQRMKADSSLRVPSLLQGKRPYDLAMGCLFLLCGAGLVPEALSYPGTSGIFPLIALGLLIVGSVAVCLRALLGSDFYAGDFDSPFASVMGSRVAAIFVFVIVYTVVMLLVGFYFSTLLFVLSMSLYLRRIMRKSGEGMNAGCFVRHAVFSLAYTAALWFVFSEVFLLQMPADLLI